MTIGEFREKTKNAPDDYNLIMSVYSNINGTDFVSEVDTMGCTVNDSAKEVVVIN